MILNGNALHVPLADQSVQCVVTSPPYWGLRDYGIGGQLGLEPTPEEYVANMVAVFREAWRVLRDDGTLWLNLGDSCWGGKGQSGYELPHEAEARRNNGETIQTSHNVPGYMNMRPSDGKHAVIKPKDLVGIPWRVAFALQADGWYLRSDIIWSKPNPMPESVTDRPTKAHEYVFLLTKQARYYYDSEAAREGFADERMGNPGIYHSKYKGNKDATLRNDGDRIGKGWERGAELNGRNRRTIWTIATQPYSGAHFATFPEALVEPCLLAGTSERGRCPVCGKAWRRVVEKGEAGKSWHDHSDDQCAGMSQFKPDILKGGDFYDKYKAPATTGWLPACEHDAAPVPCTVFDPFAGSGTVGVVAQRFGRRFVGLELSMPYIRLAQERIAKANGYHVGRLI
jgi:DNA modification methylase